MDNFVWGLGGKYPRPTRGEEAVSRRWVPRSVARQYGSGGDALSHPRLRPSPPTHPPRRRVRYNTKIGTQYTYVTGLGLFMCKITGKGHFEYETAGISVNCVPPRDAL